MKSIKSPKKERLIYTIRGSLEDGVYYNKEEYKIKDKIEYIGNEEKSDIKNLQISNQGGLILLRVVNEDIGSYVSNEDKEIIHDGTLIGKVGVTNEELNFTISFDLSIESKSEKKFKTRITLEMPKGNLIQEGTTNYQIFGTDELVFKRY